MEFCLHVHGWHVSLLSDDIKSFASSRRRSEPFGKIRGELGLQKGNVWNWTSKQTNHHKTFNFETIYAGFKTRIFFGWVHVYIIPKNQSVFLYQHFYNWIRDFFFFIRLTRVWIGLWLNHGLRPSDISRVVFVFLFFFCSFWSQTGDVNFADIGFSGDFSCDAI